MKVSAIYEFLNEYAPFSVQDKFDNSGFLVGDMNAPVKGICLCLDITNDVIKEAVANKANLIISHHPVIFDPLKSVTEGMPVYELIKNKLNAVCVHTNADMTKNGVTDIMLDLLEFERSDKILEPVMPMEQATVKYANCLLPLTPRLLLSVARKRLTARWYAIPKPTDR